MAVGHDEVARDLQLVAWLQNNPVNLPLDSETIGKFLGDVFAATVARVMEGSEEVTVALEEAVRNRGELTRAALGAGVGNVRRYDDA